MRSLHQTASRLCRRAKKSSYPKINCLRAIFRENVDASDCSSDGTASVAPLNADCGAPQTPPPTPPPRPPIPRPTTTPSPMDDPDWTACKRSKDPTWVPPSEAASASRPPPSEAASASRPPAPALADLTVPPPMKAMKPEGKLKKSKQKRRAGKGAAKKRAATKRAASAMGAAEPAAPRRAAPKRAARKRAAVLELKDQVFVKNMNQRGKFIAQLRQGKRALTQVTGVMAGGDPIAAEIGTFLAALMNPTGVDGQQTLKVRCEILSGRDVQVGTFYVSLTIFRQGLQGTPLLLTWHRILQVD